jgi:hypothetical protein
MKAEFVGSLWYYFTIAFMLLVALCNALLALRALRSVRWNYDIRQVLWAYEQELLKRGIVMLPPRCIGCCQILPRHVRGCDMGKFYESMGKVAEFTTRPPIKYYRDGSQPPDLGGPKNAH